MTDDAVRRDRRTELKTLHRERILAAAAALLDERDGAGFSVDELAERADVSRRTVFNHFAGIDDVVVHAASREIDAMAASFDAARDASEAVTPADTAELLRTLDFVTTIARMSRVLPRDAATDAFLLPRVLEHITSRVVAEPDLGDELGVELYAAALTAGLAVIAHRWLDQTGGATDAPARRAWDDLLDTLLTRLRPLGASVCDPEEKNHG